MSPLIPSSFIIDFPDLEGAHPASDGNRGPIFLPDTADSQPLLNKPHHTHIRPSTAPTLSNPSPSSSFELPMGFLLASHNSNVAQEPKATLITRNTLRAKERIALLRSTRKLEHVLGVAVKVVDEDKPAESADVAKKPPRPRRALRRTDGSSPSVLVSTTTQVFSDTSSVSTDPSSPLLPVSPPTSPVQNSSAPPLRSRATSASLRAHSKASLVCAGSYSVSNEAPVLRLHSFSPSDSHISPNQSIDASSSSIISGRDRSGSVSTIASTSTINTIDSISTVTPISRRLNKLRPFSMPPSPSSPAFGENHHQRMVSQVTKLQRHFGEAVPTDLVANPAPSMPSTRPLTHARSFSLWPMKGIRQRRGSDRPGTAPSRGDPDFASKERLGGRETSSRSMDLRGPRADWQSTISTLPPPSPSEPGHSSRSALLPDEEAEVLLPPTMEATGSFAESAPTKNGSSLDATAMTALEKSLNVRRAQKMAQRFGDAPPQALFQITNISINIHQANHLHSLRDSVSELGLPRTPHSARSMSDSFKSTRISASSSVLIISTTLDREKRSSVQSENVAIAEVSERKGLHRRPRGNSVGSICLEGTTRARGASVSSMGTGGASMGRSLGALNSSNVKQSTSSLALPSNKTSSSENLTASPAIALLASSTVVGDGDDAPQPISSNPAEETTSNPQDNLTPNPPASKDTASSSSDALSIASSSKTDLRHRRSRSILNADLPSTDSLSLKEPFPHPLQPHNKFMTRRRRARKLSSFFGVDYPDLYQAMVVPDAKPDSNSGAANTGVRPSIFVTDEHAPPLPSLNLLQELTRKGSMSAKSSLYAAKTGASVSTTSGDVSMGRSTIARLAPAPGRGKDSMESCRWSQADPDEVRNVMDKLRELKA